VRADDEQIGLPGSGGLRDALVRHPLEQQALDSEARLLGLPDQRGEMLLSVGARGARHVLVNLRRDVAVGHHRNARGEHVHEHELGAIGLGHVHRALVGGR
jgi:hypothetical protein